jgi:hypothetical protein
VYDLIPKYLILKKYNKFILYACYTAILAATAVIITVYLGFIFFFNLEYQQMPALTKSPAVLLVCVLLIVVLASSLKILKHNYRSLEENKSLETKFLETQLQLKEQELTFLKMQIQPHFLFNSLNTIYGLALQKKEEAPEMILKLSNLLDYILYQVDKPTVLLTDEINHLKDYISLEKMRFHDTLKVSFKEEVADAKSEIAPMMLLPFLENSFKHGVLIDGFLVINIFLKVDKEYLFFEVENYFLKTTIFKNGIGFKNIKKRLELLYPKKHSLEILQEETTFKITLKIEF